MTRSRRKPGREDKVGKVFSDRNEAVKVLTVNKGVIQY